MLLLDYIGLAFFFISWIAYVRYAKIKSVTKSSLMGIMPKYRKQWMANMVEFRELRIFDSSLLGNLMRVTTFFASTTVLLLFATITGFGAAAKISQTLSHVVIINNTSTNIILLKLLILSIVFVYAFFKFTWSLRQLGFVSVLSGSAPDAKQEPNNKINNSKIIYQLSALEGLSANNFTNGLRAYYFSLAILMWFIHPIALIIATLTIVLVLYRREFHSDTLKILQGINGY